MRYLILILLVTISLPAPAAPSYQFCVFDVVGRYGDVFALLKEYRTDALREGISLEMTAYREELDAIAAFKRGECDLVSLSDIGVREFNRFSGSISAIGAVPHYGDLRILTHTLTNERVAPVLENEKYEILGVLPLGTVYLFVNDRAIDRVEDLAGKRIAVLPDHRDAEHMIRFVDAIPVPAKISTFGRMFNNGEVDIIYAPAAAYEALELYKGMGEKGGVVRYPVGQFSAQLVARKDVFPDEFVKRSRELIADMFSRAMLMTFRFERAIPDERWVEIPEKAFREYHEMLRQVRLDILHGEVDPKVAEVYHPTMLKLLRKIRCYTSPGLKECRAEVKE